MPEPSASAASPFRSLLVHVDSDYGTSGRIRLAAKLAASFDAVLIGASASHEIELFHDDMMQPLEFTIATAAEQKRVTRQLSEAEENFRKHASALRALEWYGACADKTEHLLALAAMADLIVVGRRESSDALIDGSTLSVGAVVVGAGRPVLIVPPEIDDLVPGRILIAWKNTKEARRSVRDALPFLIQAKDVAAVRIGSVEDGTDFESLVTYLDRHGITCTIETMDANDDRASDVLMRLTEDAGFDLLVAGGYGHGRRREYLFGGMSKDLIATAPICCLLSN